MERMALSLDQDLTIVMQGPVDGPFDIHASLADMRKLFPRACFKLATQANKLPPRFDLAAFDAHVLTEDAGSLPSVKFEEAPHNVNRQITTSAAGLTGVTTRFAMKMRADSLLTSHRIFEYWGVWADAPDGGRRVGADRILTVSFYTLNPRFDERLAYHVSDWLQFGITSDLQRMWHCPFYSMADATFYERTRYAEGSLPRERQFRARFATEQWLALNYLYRDRQFPIRFHNDCSEAVAQLFEQDLVDNYIVVHPKDIDLALPKHDRVYKSRYANLRNYSYEDWKTLVEKRLGERRALTGFTSWPRTRFQKALYMTVRRKRRTRIAPQPETARNVLPRITMSKS